MPCHAMPCHAYAMPCLGARRVRHVQRRRRVNATQLARVVLARDVRGRRGHGRAAEARHRLVAAWHSISIYYILGVISAACYMICYAMPCSALLCHRLVRRGRQLGLHSVQLVDADGVPAIWGRCSARTKQQRQQCSGSEASRKAPSARHVGEEKDVVHGRDVHLSIA